MTVDEIQTFVENNLYGDVPTETYNQIMTDAESMDSYSFNEKWGKFLNENSDGWVTMKKDFKPLSERLSKAFGSSDKENPFKRSKNELDEIYEKEFSDDVPRDMFDQALSKQSNYWEDFKNEREKEAGEIRRENEVKNWGLMRNVLASDYEKQRYIKDPGAALFGNEAPNIGEAKDTRWGAMGDLGAGVAAGAADIGTAALSFTPAGVAANMLAGPTIRAARDLAHKATDSPYQKDYGDIARGFATDVGFNAGAEILANARKVHRIAQGMADTKNNAFKYYETTNNINNSINTLNKNLDKGLSNGEWNEVIKSLPESPLKQELMGVKKEVSEIGGDLGDEVADLVVNYKVINNPKIQAQALDQFNQGRPLITNNTRTFLETPKQQELFSELALGTKPTKGQLRMYKGLDVVDQINKGNLGTGVFETGRNLSSMNHAQVNTDEADKNWFKNNYTRDWLLGFKPDKNDQKSNSPKWQAYKEWYYDKYGVMPQED